MNFQQMRCLVELRRNEFAIGRTARALTVSQPAITKQLRQLEDELGAPLVVRRSNRIEGATSLGREVIRLAEEVCLNIDTIQRLARESVGRERSEIRIAATDAQAKFVLPAPLQEFAARHQNVAFELKEAGSDEIVALVAAGEVDFGVTPAPPVDDDRVIFVPYRSYRLIALAPKDHPLARKRRVSLATLATQPIITTGAGQVGRNDVINAFKRGRLEPKILLGAPNFDVVKSCVIRGLGVTIMPSYTYDRERDPQIRQVDVDFTFPESVTNIVLRRNMHAPLLVYRLLEMLLPRWRSPA